MIKLLIFVAIALYLLKLVTGRWLWEPKISRREQAKLRAGKLLGIPAGSPREEIIGAHRRLVTQVHPDRGGSSAQIHEANAARDLLLGELPDHT